MQRPDQRLNGRALALLLTVLTVAFLAVVIGARAQQKGTPPLQGSGSLRILDDKGATGEACPLKHTDVNAEISGSIARVTVTQEFTNTTGRKIEAVYVFPLPQNAAVDDMTMRVGDRTIRGVIKQRDEARKIYETAKQQGHVASLLDQERPNIFTQSVANIMPGAAVTITISYVELLKYEEGSYQFVFPMVVGPRYIPGQPTDRTGGGWADNTTKVPDASKITPPVAKPGTRAGHDISLSVTLDAGVAIQDLRSELHKVDIDRTGANSARVRLQNQKELPNTDFILRYDVSGPQIADAVLTHRNNDNGYFALLLQPPERFPESDVTPKELVFVLDTSGSMSGFPIEKGKELIDRALKGLNSRDTFNLITFAGDTRVLFPEPVYPSAANLSRAHAFLDSREGGGGTEMMKAIRAALDPSDEQDHIRIVMFVTDGFVGNDMEILGEIQKHPKARVFSFGIGQSINRFLLDGMAREGRGEAEYVTLQGDADAAVKRLYERVRSPLLTDIELDFGSLPVAEVFPTRVPDLFSAKPLVVYGRYTQPARGTVTIRAKRAGSPWSRTINLDLPSAEKSHDVLAGLWARQKIDSLMAQNWKGLQRGTTAPDIEKQITQLGLDYRLMTQFTSFVAVEERTVTDGGAPVTVQVPVEMPEGVRYEGVFGAQEQVGGIAGGQMGGAIGGTVTGRNFQTLAKMSPSTARMSEARVDAASSYETILPARSKDELTTIYEAKNSTEIDARRSALAGKLDAELFSAWECHRLAVSNRPRPVSCKNVPPGSNLRVEITVSALPSDALAQLKQLGFVRESSAKVLVGHLPISSLNKLAELPFVTFIKSARRS